MGKQIYRCEFKGVKVGHGDSYLTLKDNNGVVYEMKPCNDAVLDPSGLYGMTHDGINYSMCYSCAVYLYVNFNYDFLEGEEDRVVAKFGPMLPRSIDVEEDFYNAVQAAETVDVLFGSSAISATDLPDWLEVVHELGTSASPQLHPKVEDISQEDREKEESLSGLLGLISVDTWQELSDTERRKMRLMLKQMKKNGRA